MAWSTHAFCAGVAILTEKKDGKVAPGPNYITVGRNLAMELVRVTEVLLYSFLN